MATTPAPEKQPKAEPCGIGVWIDDNEDYNQCTWKGGMKKEEAIEFIEENMGFDSELLGLVYVMQSLPPKNLNELIPQYAGNREELILALKS